MVQCADAISTSLMDIITIEKTATPVLPVETAELMHEQLRNAQEAVQTIVHCAAHQKRIVDDILIVSKLDSNLVSVTPVETNTIQMVEETIRIFEVEARTARIKLTFKIDGTLKDNYAELVLIDSTRLTQVLINLITNAIKFTRDERQRLIILEVSATKHKPTEHPSGVHYISSAQDTKAQTLFSGQTKRSVEELFLEFAVHDTGCGLHSDEAARLFTRFAQASPKTYVRYGGSGLGLFLCRQLTELQGGHIGLKSEFGKGSTFAFYIKAWTYGSPSTSSLPLPVRMHAPQVEFTPEMDAKTGIKDDSMLSVLVVEDNLVNQKILTKQLKQLGCGVFAAGNGLEALEFLKTTTLWKRDKDTWQETGNEPRDLDVILMDIEMPVMDGLTAARTIRTLEERGHLLGHLPIISISANARMEQMEEARAAGCDQSITKPFRLVQLMPKMQTLVQQSKTRAV